MSGGKTDMSAECGFKYFEYWIAMNNGDASEVEFHDWFDKNCGHCKYMNEICMYGEN